MNGERGTASGHPRRGVGRRTALEPLSHPALVDGSTDLPNRTYFAAVLRVIFALGRRGVPLSVLLLAVDGPAVETAGDGGEGDVRGEDPGAPDFERLVSTLRNATRGGDLFARVDRDVFALLMVDCNAQGAITAADRLRDAVGEWREDTGWRVSAGVAGWMPSVEAPGALWELAAEALADARRAATGGVVLARSPD